MTTRHGLTPSQTAGPYFAYGLTPDDYDFAPLAGPDLTGPDVPGERIRIEGRITDGDGAGLADAFVEIWQADAQGRYASPLDGRATNTAFRGFGRRKTDAQGFFGLTTIKPGRAPGPQGKLQAPHILVSVFARGIVRRLATRLYFADEPGNADDFVLGLVPPGRRATLIARRADRDGLAVHVFDIRLQGVSETVFFEV